MTGVLFIVYLLVNNQLQPWFQLFVWKTPDVVQPAATAPAAPAAGVPALQSPGSGAPNPSPKGGFTPGGPFNIPQF
jgi:hypothetical protein